MASPGPGKKLCGAQRPGQPQGVTCRNIAGKGTEHRGVGRCSRHLGNTESHVKAAEGELAQQAVSRYGLAVDIDPATAMMQLVAKSHGSVLYLEAHVAALEVPWLEDRPHVAWVMLMAERKHHAEVCRDAVRAGVERRAIELMEDKAREHVAVLRAMCVAMGWDPRDPKVLEAGKVALQVLPGGQP